MKKLFFLLVLHLLIGVQINAQVCFDAPIDFDAGSYISQICVDDFNNDTIPDLAVSNYSSWNLSIVLGNGDGTFGSPLFLNSSNTMYGPESIVSGDFDGDGNKDIATTTFKPDTISVFIGNGDGTFNQGVEISVLGPVRNLVTGDFNEDGLTDLVGLRTYGSWVPNVFVFIASGSGNFNPSVDLTSSDYPTGITITDMNNNNDDDIIVCSGTTTSVFLGNGAGGFGSAINTFNSNTFVQGIDHADFNNDNNQDIVMSNGAGSSVWVYFGNGVGNFLASPLTIPVPSYNKSVFAADLNGDMKMDIASANYSANTISVLIGSGFGSFSNPINYTVYNSPNCITGADFNLDGAIDLAVGNSSPPSNNSSVLLNNPPLLVTGVATPINICSGDSVILTGSGATIYTWDYLNNGLVDTSNVNPPIVDGVPFLLDSTQSFLVTGTTGTCSGWDTIVVNVSPVPTQNLCVISTDSTTGSYNLVVWEKPLDIDHIDSFFVYREITLNNYQKIGAVHKDSLSLFEDHGANPNTTSYKYKIAALDVCGNEGQQSLYHNSIHLQYFGLGNFQWTLYTIESTPNQVASYNFYRDDNATGNFQLIQVIPGGNQSYTDINYNSFPNALYRVDLTWLSAHGCTPTRTELATSRSNIMGQVQIGVEENNLSNLINIYPNPADEFVTITLPSALIGEEISLLNMMGQKIASKIIISETITFDMSSFNSGIYLLDISTQSGNISKKVLKK